MISLPKISRGQYGHLNLERPRAINNMLSLHNACPHVNNTGGFNAVACSLLTGHVNIL